MSDIRLKLPEIIAREKTLDRWAAGTEHHPKSEELFLFLSELDFNVYGDYFRWKAGGDGDNGETLMYQLDAFFEAKEPAAPNLTNPTEKGEE